MEDKKIKFDEKFCQRCDVPVEEKVTSCPLQCMSSKCPSYMPRPHIDPLVTPIIWVLGGPGCGKGTQCALISKKYNFTHLSTGELLRDEVAKGTGRAKCIANVIERGDLVSTDIVLDLVKKAMLANVNSASGFLVDGYPREAAQGEAFERVIAPVTTILYFSATRDTLWKRLMHRAKNSTRLDDNEETILRRLNNFFGSKDTIIEKHASKVNKINAEGTPEAISQWVFNILDHILAECKRQLEERTEAAIINATGPTPTTTL